MTDIQYCDDCGLLHDLLDGECIGCEQQQEIKLLNNIRGALKLQNKTAFEAIDRVTKILKRIQAFHDVHKVYTKDIATGKLYELNSDVIYGALKELKRRN